jgi:hydroxymethylpyrimidine kinase/phosphomethylpyrimidine kinase/hydroxyethylthiazole kinase
MKTALTIAGSDCSGGAGIQADLKTFAAHGVYGMSVITSVVAENTVRVIEYQDIQADIIAKQLDAVFEDIFPDAVKIGMLSSREIMLCVAEKLNEWRPQNIVVDPVMYAKNGSALMNPDAIDTLLTSIVPLADVITPNIPEAEKMSGIQIDSIDDMKKAAVIIHASGCKAVLVKGGHASGDATDILFDGHKFYSFISPRFDTKNTHGTGCTFSSAIAANLALGLDLENAARAAKEYISGAIRNALPLGKGHGPTNHFYQFHQFFNEEKPQMEIYSLIEKLRSAKPLIHHITNYVTVNDCANITLGIGASPIMADANEEAADIAAISSAVVINMGTLNPRTVASMLLAGKSANTAGVPVVFDPVGAGASKFRNETAAALMSEVKFTVIRGNISEIKYIAGLKSETKGVDAGAGDVNSTDGLNIAKTLAKRENCIVAITGATDIISNGANTYLIKNGQAMLANLTGTGCMCTSLIGSFVGAAPETPLEATVCALLSMGIAGEIAYEKAGEAGNGSFRAALHDAISKMDAKTLETRAKLNVA